MNNTLTSLLLAGTVALTGASMGCKRDKSENAVSQIPNNQLPSLPTEGTSETIDQLLSMSSAPIAPQNYDSSWNVTSNKLSKVTGDQSPFSLEYVIRDGGQYAVGKAVEPRTNEHPNIILYAMDNTSIVIDDGARKVEPLSTRVYVPTSITNSQGELLGKANLSASGPDGTKTKRQAINLNSGGVAYGVVNYTEADADYSINTLVIAGEEFYAPLASTPRTNALNFYLIPKAGTKREITPNGTLVLHSTRGMYSLNTMNSCGYFGRTNANNANVSTNGIPQNDGSGPKVDSFSK